MTSLVALTVKNLPAMQETQGQSLDWENPPEKGIAAHSNILVFVFVFNWKLITLQYCGGFCQTLTGINHGVHVSPTPNSRPLFLPIPPSGLSQCTSFECAASCIELGLVICFTYGNIMLFSQIIPPLPSPTESKILFFTSVSPLLSCI